MLRIHSLALAARHAKDRGYGTLGSIPLVVIARGNMASPSSQDDLTWRARQEKLATLSSNSLFLVANNSGHVIPLDRPDVVADAVRRILQSGGAKLAER